MNEKQKFLNMDIFLSGGKEKERTGKMVSTAVCFLIYTSSEQTEGKEGQRTDVCWLSNFLMPFSIF